MNECPTELIGQVTAPWSGPLARVDAAALRAAYAALMDRAAERIQPAGYDQDDVILERLILLHDATDAVPRLWTTPLPLLADAADIVNALNAQRRDLNLPACDPDQVTVSALQIAILRETNIPLPDLRVPWNYDPQA